MLKATLKKDQNQSVIVDQKKNTRAIFTVKVTPNVGLLLGEGSDIVLALPKPGRKQNGLVPRTSAQTGPNPALQRFLFQAKPGR